MLLFRTELFTKCFKFNRLFNPANAKNIGKYYFKNYSSQPRDLLRSNTAIVKDAMLFKYDNPKFFKYLNMFGISQFAFWLYLSHFAFTTLKDVPVPKDGNEDLPWWRNINLGEQNYRNGITLFCGAVGYLFLFASWTYTIRSVRYLILNKGGNMVSFVTYGPFGKNAIMKVPVNKAKDDKILKGNSYKITEFMETFYKRDQKLKEIIDHIVSFLISAAESREHARVQLPLKVEGKFFYYMLDMKGEFPNKLLFDATAGLRRNLK